MDCVDPSSIVGHGKSPRVWCRVVASVLRCLFVTLERGVCREGSTCRCFILCKREGVKEEEMLAIYDGDGIKINIKFAAILQGTEQQFQKFIHCSFAFSSFLASNGKERYVECMQDDEVTKEYTYIDQRLLEARHLVNLKIRGCH